MRETEKKKLHPIFEMFYQGEERSGDDDDGCSGGADAPAFTPDTAGSGGAAVVVLVF